MSIWIAWQEIFYRLNPRESSPVPVDNQMDLIRHPPEVRVFINSPATVYQVEVCLRDRLFQTDPFEIPVHWQLANT